MPHVIAESVLNQSGEGVVLHQLAQVPISFAEHAELLHVQKEHVLRIGHIESEDRVGRLVHGEVHKSVLQQNTYNTKHIHTYIHT